MTFVLRDSGTPTQLVGGWPVTGSPKFVPSKAYERLHRALRRYVDEDIPGRSFLIAGHRGTGKTALVTRAVEDLRIERLLDSVKEAGPFTGGTRVAMQRPLFVKLHGPSLLAAALTDEEAAAAANEEQAPANPAEPAEAPTGEEAAAAANEEQAPANPAEPAGTKPDPSGAAGPGAPAPQPEARDPVSTQSHVALVQITLALYRALAAEIGTGFLAHAKIMAERASASNDFLEIAAQLALELDAAPDPAVLRRYWNMLSRLPGQGRENGFGVLWPMTADPTLAELKLQDQGLREIIAVATAAQAYRVTAGKETETETSAAEAKQEAQITASSANLNDMFNRAAALLSGGLAGAATVGTSPTAAVGIGLGTALLTGLVLNWSSSRSHKRQHILNYTFIRRRDEATLERDLPTVIARVRAAGLAPVFVLDELDKLDDPRTRIRLIINRLKHIVTDHGFFCFLTDRNYFDQTEQLIEGGVYPVEHTFFSERLLVLYGSSEFLTFLTDIIAIVPPTAENEEFARLLLSFNIIHHAKRNFADLTREISRLAGEDGKLRVTAEQVLLQPSYRLVAVMQLAVDEILRRPALTGRFESDPGFAQLAVDALYMVSREWEKGSKEVDLSTEKVRRCLNERLAGAAVRVDPKRPRPPPPKVSNADLDVLVEQVHALCGLLSNLESLRAAVRDWSNLPGCANPETVIPESLSGGLLEKAPGSEPVWKFLYDSSGAPRKSSAEMAADDKADERRRLRAFADQASKLVAAAGLSIEDLVAAKVLPKSITWTHVLQAAVDDASAPAATEPAASAPLREFESVFTNRLSGVRDTLLLVRMFRERAGLPLTDAPKVLVRLGRYLNFEAAASPGSAAAPLVPPGLEMPVAPALASPEDMEALTDWLLDSGEADEPVPITPALQTSAWDKWRDRLETHFSATAASWTVTANDLLLAAADRPPSSWLRAPLDQMNIGDWSLLALRCIQESAPTPPWAALAALRALGFGQSLLQRMMGRLLASPALHTWPPADIESSSRLVSTSVDRSAGLLHIAAGPGAVLDSHPGRLPVLGVQLADCEIYRNALDALYDVSAYRALTYEPF